MSSKFSHFSKFDDGDYVRLSQLLQGQKRQLIPGPLPFSAPTLWRKVRNGSFPKPVKLGPRVTAWNVGVVRAWIAQCQPGGGSDD